MSSILRLHGDACAVVIDRRALPIVFATWTGAPDLALIDAYFAAQIDLSIEQRSSGRRMVIVSDCRAMGRASPLARKRIADHTAAQRELFGATMLGSCTVFSSALVRGVLTALAWLDPDLRVPSFATLDAALAWATKEITAAGMLVPVVDLLEVAEVGSASTG
jgi:hypothetical protein